MAVNYKIYQSKLNNSTADKFYARATHRDTVGISEIASTMQANCTVKKSDILAVLTELSEVVKAELQRSNRVKIDGLGTFKVGLSTKPAPTAKDFTAANVKGAHVIFMPEITTDASGKRVKALLAGLKVKEADSYKSLKEEELAE